VFHEISQNLSVVHFAYIANELPHDLNKWRICQIHFYFKGMNIVQVSYKFSSAGCSLQTTHIYLPIVPIIIHLPKIGKLVCFALVSEADPWKNWKEGLGDRLGRKFTLHPECRHA